VASKLSDRMAAVSDETAAAVSDETAAAEDAAPEA
jgi:hypothetical protein